MALRLILTDGNGIQALALGFGAFINTNYAQIEAAVLSVAQSAATASAAAALSTTNANNAQANATAAGNSATAAAASAASATASATSASNSATAASSSATTAGNQAIASADSASAAAGSASAAAGSATAAATSASNAAATLANALTKANNLSDVANVATARGNLGAAAKGANSDITSLTGLTTMLPINQGGTGSATAATARTALGVAASGANSDILSLSGLTTALSVAQGGTGGNTTALARINLGIVGKNLLHNPRFTINQRGYVSGQATTGGANTFIIDRWKIQVNGQNASWTTSGNHLILTAPAGGVAQVITADDIVGGTYSLSWAGTATATVNGTNRANGASFTLTAGATATVVFSNGTVELPQLESGAVSTFEPRPEAIEWLICEHFYRRLTFRGYNAIVTNGHVQCYFTFPAMLTAPSTAFIGTPTQSSCTGINVALLTANAILIQAAGTIAGVEAVIAGTIELSADI